MLFRSGHVVVRPAQLNLGALALGDVAQRAHQPRHPPRLVAHRERAVDDPGIAAGGVADAVLVFELPLAPLEIGDDRVAVALEVLAVDACVPRRGGKCVARDREEGLGEIGEVQRAGLEVPLVDALGRRLDRKSVV